jgi:hypothetical protein
MSEIFMITLLPHFGQGIKGSAVLSRVAAWEDEEEAMDL